MAKAEEGRCLSDPMWPACASMPAPQRNGSRRMSPARRVLHSWFSSGLSVANTGDKKLRRSNAHEESRQDHRCSCAGVAGGDRFVLYRQFGYGSTVQHWFAHRHAVANRQPSRRLSIPSRRRGLCNHLQQAPTAAPTWAFRSPTLMPRRRSSSASTSRRALLSPA